MSVELTCLQTASAADDVALECMRAEEEESCRATSGNPEILVTILLIILITF